MNRHALSVLLTLTVLTPTVDTTPSSGLYNHDDSTVTAPSVMDELARNSSMTSVESDIVDVWLLGLFPFNGSWPGGLGQLPAVEMGIDDVNNNPEMLPGYRLHLSVNNTQVSIIVMFF